MLLSLFFWRRLELEGGSALVRGLVEAAPRGMELRLLLPSPVPGLPEAPVVSYARRTRLGTLLAYLRHLRREARRAGTLVLLDNNPAFHLLFSPLVPGLRRALVFVVAPCFESRVAPTGRGRRPDRQAWAHRLGKSAAVARWAGRLFGHRALAYVVSTAYQQEQLARLGFPASRVMVAPFGAAGEFPAPVAAREGDGGGERLVIGYLGHYSPVKGVPELVRAVHALAVAARPVELRIAWSGKGTERAEVESLLAAVPAPGIVRVEGRVDVASFLAGLDLVVLPMRHESFPHPPLVLVEALAAGVPVVASDAGGLPDLLAPGPFGAVFPRGDAAALAALLREIEADRGRLAAWRRNIAEDAGRLYDNRALWARLMARRGTGSGAGAPGGAPARSPAAPAPGEPGRGDARSVRARP